VAAIWISPMNRLLQQQPTARLEEPRRGPKGLAPRGFLRTRQHEAA
jgi:hypothetical protein